LDRIFRNDGNQFTDTSEQSGIEGLGHGHAALCWDFNHDLLPDIYVAIDIARPDKLYRNNGDFTFTDVIDEVIPQASYYAMGGDFGDIDGNGHSDLWIADMAATSRLQYMKSLGSDGHMHTREQGHETGLQQYTKNTLLLSLGPEQYTEISRQANLDRPDWTWAARLADLDNDADLDAYVTNGMLRAFNDGGLVKKVGNMDAHTGMISVYKPSPTLNERNLAFSNMGGLQFKSQTDAWGLGKLGVSFGAAFGDIDRDGDLDIVTNNLNEPPSVFRNDSTKGNSIAVRLVGVKSNSYGIGSMVTVTTSEVSQVKTLQPTRGYMSTDEPILHFGLGSKDSIDSLTVQWPSGIVQKLHDIEVNGIHTIVEQERGNKDDLPGQSLPRFNQASIELPSSATRKENYHTEFTKQEHLPYHLSRRGGELIVQDFNQDGLDDIILGGSAGQSTILLENRGQGAFSEVLSFDIEDDFSAEDQAHLLGDFDQDDTLELIVASGSNEYSPQDSFYADRIYDATK